MRPAAPLPCLLLALAAACVGGCAEAPGGRTASAATTPPGAEPAAAGPTAGAAPGGTGSAVPATGSAAPGGTGSAAPGGTGSAGSAPGQPPEDAIPGPASPPSAAAPGPRVYARSRFVWVQNEPRVDSGWTGYLWLGGSVRLARPAPVPGSGCAGAWHAVEPRGFVCVDGVRATLDESDRAVQALRAVAPDLTSPWPHRYAESRGAVKYPAPPERALAAKREWDFEEHQARVAAAARGEARHRSLEGVDLTPAAPRLIDLASLGLPATAHEPRNRLRPLSTVTYSAEALIDGRSYLLTGDLRWVPKDRVVPYPEVTFGGVELKDGLALPLAFFRDEGRVAWARAADGKLAPTERRFARLSHLALTGEAVEQDGARFLAAREAGVFVREADAIVPRPRPLTPWGAPVGGEDTTGKRPAGRATWIEASIWQGWLVAFEGTRAVYVTLISPGRGGTPERGKDPVSTASTPVGTFKITGKFATATMEAPGEFIHSDVPWTQNFSGPHALHGAYWHDAWGHRKSAGCVNVSPVDGRWLFTFTEPPLPPGWHGVKWRPSDEPATTFVVHE